MERFKYAFLLPILCLFFLQGCVHGDLEDCPPMVRYAVAFKYTDHTENGDRFYDDVKKSICMYLMKIIWYIQQRLS